MEKVLFIDESRAERAFSAVNKACLQAKSIFDAISDKGIVPTREEIERLIKNNDTSSLVSRYKQNEYDKLATFVDQYKNTVLTSEIDEKVNRITETVKRELLNCRNLCSYYALNYFDYLAFTQDTVEIIPEYTLDYFMDKFSVKLTEPQHFEFYDQHIQLVRLMNDLADHPENEFAAVEKLLYFDPVSKEFQINIEAYMPEIFDKENVELTNFLSGK